MAANGAARRGAGAVPYGPRGAGTGSAPPQKRQIFSLRPPGPGPGSGPIWRAKPIRAISPIRAIFPHRRLPAFGHLGASLALTVAGLLLGSGAAWADPGLGQPPVPRTPSAKRMVLDRQMMLVSAFARYLEQQLGMKATTPIGRGVTLELAPRPDGFGGAPDLVALRRPLMAAEGVGPAGSTHLSTVVSATADRLKLTFRLRW